MTVLMSLSQAWAGVVGALGGVAITGLIALVTAVVNHRWTAEATREARAHEVRANRGEVRRTAYARLLAATDNMRDALLATSENLREARASGAPSDAAAAEQETPYAWYHTNPEVLREYQTADGEARIVAGDDVFHAIDFHGAELQAYLSALFETPESADITNTAAAQEAMVQAMRQEQASDLTP